MLQASILPGLWKGIAKNSDGSPDIRGLQDIIHLLVNLIQIALFLAGLLAVIFIIIGGIKYITSAGSPDGVKSAKNTLTGAITGLALAILSYAIVNFIVGTF